jgi:hypothetical protein
LRFNLSIRSLPQDSLPLTSPSSSYQDAEPDQERHSSG